MRIEIASTISGRREIHDAPQTEHFSGGPLLCHLYSLHVKLGTFHTNLDTSQIKFVGFNVKLDAFHLKLDSIPNRSDGFET